MSVSATLTPGIILTDGPVTISDLNKLGTPTVDISGAVGTLSLSDGSVTNAKVASAAGIQYDKLEALATGELVVGNAGVATATALSGDATIDASGVITVAPNAIVNSKVSSSAAIAYSKLASLTDANILVGNSSNVATVVAVSGDVTLANDGGITVDADAITYAKIQNVSATDRLLGRDTAGAGDVEEITPANVRTMLNVADGANAYVHPNHSGDVTSTADGATVIAADAVTTAKILDANVTSAKLESAIAIPAGGSLADGVTATTQATADSSTKVATTAHVQAAVDADITTHAALRSSETVFGHAKIYVTGSVLYIKTS